MVELVKAEKCKRGVILNYFGYDLPKRTGPDHTCGDFHQQRCCCDDLFLIVASEMMENAQINGSDDNVLLGSTEAAHQNNCSSNYETKNVAERIPVKLQTVPTWLWSCVGSVGLSAGFSLELVDAIIEHACELTSIDTLKSKLPLFDNDHAHVIFEIVQSVKST